MRRRLVVSYVVLVSLALVLFTVPVVLNSAAVLRGSLEDTVRREADLFVPLVRRDDAEAAGSLADRTRDFAAATGARVVVVRAGRAAPDAQVAAALRGAEPVARWTDDAALGDAVSVALPVRAAGGSGPVVAVVQVVAPAASVQQQIRSIWVFRLVTGAVVLALATVVAVLLSGSLVRPLRRLDAVALRWARGEDSVRAPTSGPPEVAGLAATLNESTRRVAELLASQRAFVADASHQLRTPLTAVRLHVDNLREDLADAVAADDGPAARDVLREAERAATAVEGEIVRMAGLVEGLLALARAESPTRAPEVVDLAELLRARRAVWAAAFQRAAVECVLDAPAPALVRVTPGAVEQVLDNLVSNALAAAPSGSRVWLRVTVRTAVVELEVRDEGPGMDAAQRDRAFDRFWRSGPSGGSGLGLAVVRRLVDNDGGSAALRPATGAGLSAVVTWPGGAGTTVTRP